MKRILSAIAVTILVALPVPGRAGTNQPDCAGIGILVMPHNSTKIMSVTPGGPAALAGVQMGDVLTSIDENDTATMTSKEIIAALRGDTGTTVRIAIKKRDGTQSAITLTRVDLSSFYPGHSPAVEADTKAEPAPTALATNTEQALVQILQALQKINARLDKLEDPDDDRTSRSSHRSSGPDRKLLNAIQYPEDPTKENVRNYVDRIAIATEGQNSYSTSDPQVPMLARVGEENMDILIDAAETSGRGMSHYHINRAIQRLATEKSKDLILRALNDNRELAEVVLENNWQGDARDTLVTGLSDAEYLPSQWIECVASFKDPATYDALLGYFVRGMNRSQTYNVIKDLPGISMDKSVDDAWLRARRSHHWERCSMAIIAISYGRQDALEQLIRDMDAKDMERNSHLRDQAQFAILDHTDVTNAELDDLKAWYAASKDSLTFDPATKKFTRAK